MKGVRTSVMLAAICLGRVGSEAGSLYVANYGDSSISIVSPDTGNIIAELTTPICKAYGLVCDQANDLYVGNRGNGSVTIVAADGIGYSILASNLDAGAVTLGINSNLYTLGFYTGDIVHITPSGSVSTVASVGMAGGIALACDSASSNLYTLVNHQAVNGFGNAELYKIASDTSVSTLVDFSSFPTPYPQAMTIDTSLDGPQSLAFDTGGNLYLGTFDVFNDASTVLKINPLGNAVTLVNTNGGLNNPLSLAFSLPVPAQILSAQTTAGAFVFNFMSESNQSYTVQGNLDLMTTNWFNCTNFFGNGLVIPVSVTLSNGVSREFFRIKLP